MTRARRGGLLGTLFTIGVVIKAIDGVLEIVGAVLVLFITPERTNHLVRLLTENDLPGRAQQLVATHGVHALRHLAGDGKLFAVVYLLAHGVIKVVLVAGLLLKQRIAYPVAIVVFALFLVYQVYQYIDAQSIAMLVLSALDAFVVVMTVLEYRRLEQEHAFR